MSITQRNGHAGHDDLGKAVRFERLHEAGRQREQRLARPGGSQDGDEIDLRGP